MRRTQIFIRDGTLIGFWIKFKCSLFLESNWRKLNFLTCIHVFCENQKIDDIRIKWSEQKIIGSESHGTAVKLQFLET